MQAQDEQEMAGELERALLAQFAGVSGGGFAGEECFDDPGLVRRLERAATSKRPLDGGTSGR